MEDKTLDWSECLDLKQFVWDTVGQEVHDLRMEAARQTVWLTVLTAISAVEALAITLLWWFR